MQTAFMISWKMRSFPSTMTGQLNDLPVDWIQRMKESIRTLAPEFSMRRMVKSYATDLYFELMDLNK